MFDGRAARADDWRQREADWLRAFGLSTYYYYRGIELMVCQRCIALLNDMGTLAASALEE